MPKRGPYKKVRQRPPPPAWRRTFLADYRELKHWTQEDLAAAAGMSVGTVSGIESGETGYSAESLWKLARALGVEPGMILSIDPKGAEPLWAIIARASPEQKEQIARHADIIVPHKAAKRR